MTRQRDAIRKYHNYVRFAPSLVVADVIFSPHSLTRILERELDPIEVKQAIERPEHAYYSRGHDAWMYSRGRVRIGLTPHRDYPDKWAVTTVLNADIDDKRNAHDSRPV